MYTYDTFGQLTRKVDRNGAATTYTYSPAAQLLSEASPTVNTTWSYDPLGRPAGR
jgi:YD repeat-containing protein